LSPSLSLCLFFLSLFSFLFSLSKMITTTEEESYRLAKEDMVTGLTGTSPLNVQLTSSIALVTKPPPLFRLFLGSILQDFTLSLDLLISLDFLIS
jgi:hypothetical protein